MDSFEQRKTVIIQKTRIALDELVLNLKKLSQNLQVINSIGHSQFEATSTLWKSFQESIEDDNSLNKQQ